MTAVSEKASLGFLESQRGGLPTVQFSTISWLQIPVHWLLLYMHGGKVGHMNLASRHTDATVNTGLL